MGINRIVMQNGVVWWLPPLRRSPRRSEGRSGRQSRPSADALKPLDDASAGSAAVTGTGSGQGSDRPTSASDHGAPPAGFIPLSSLGLQGVDGLLLHQGHLYRDAYGRASGERREPPAGQKAPEDRSGPAVDPDAPPAEQRRPAA